MKNYKLNDIYVLRPMRLVKENRYAKVEFPYNLVCLLKTNSDSYLSLLEEAGKTKSKYVFEISNDIVLATKDESTQYTDIFSGQLYSVISVNDLDRDNIGEEILVSEYVSNLATLKCEQAKQECLGDATCDTSADADRYLELMQQFASIRYDIIHSEVTTEELKTFRKQLTYLNDLMRIEITLDGNTKPKIQEKRK